MDIKNPKFVEKSKFLEKYLSNTSECKLKHYQLNCWYSIRHIQFKLMTYSSFKKYSECSRNH